MQVYLLILICIFGSIHSWCPDSNEVCTCSGECSDEYDRYSGRITCIIDGTLPSLQPGNSNGQGTCYWLVVDLIINSIPVLKPSIFNPGFAIYPYLNIHQNSTDPIPFDTQPFLSNLNKDHHVSVTVTSISGPLPLAPFDTDQSVFLSFEGSFTIDKPLPLWKHPSRLVELSLNSSVYSDLPSNVFENLQCRRYSIDIYNLTVMKSNMFNHIWFLQFCNVERIESFAVDNSNRWKWLRLENEVKSMKLIINRGSNGYGYPPCTKEASVSVIEAHAFHNTKIGEYHDMWITVSADSEIHDLCFDAQNVGADVPLDLKIKVEINNIFRCDSIGHLTKYFKYPTVTIEIPTPGLSVSSDVHGDETRLIGLDVALDDYDANCCPPNAECIVKLDQISSFPLVTQLRLSGPNESIIDLNITSQFPNLSLLIYKDVCDHSLLTLPSPSNINLDHLDPSEILPDPLRLVFRAPQLSLLKLWHILKSTQPINCSCSISWMLQLRDCHSNKGDHSVDKYLNQVECANQNSTVMEYLITDTCCNSTESPTPTPNCNGRHKLPFTVNIFDHTDLPQCTTNKEWKFDPCDVEIFYYDQWNTSQTPTTSTPRKHINIAYYLPLTIGIILVICVVSVAYVIRRRRRSIVTQSTNTEVNVPSDASQNQLYGQHITTHNGGQIAYNNHTFVGGDDVVRYVAGKDYVVSPLSTAEYDNTLDNEYNNQEVYDDMDQSTSN